MNNRLKMYEDSQNIPSKDVIMELKFKKDKAKDYTESMAAWLHSVAEEIKNVDLDQFANNKIVYRYDGF